MCCLCILLKLLGVLSCSRSYPLSSYYPINFDPSNPQTHDTCCNCNVTQFPYCQCSQFWPQLFTPVYWQQWGSCYWSGLLWWWSNRVEASTCSVDFFLPVYFSNKRRSGASSSGPEKSLCLALNTWTEVFQCFRLSLLPSLLPFLSLFSLSAHSFQIVLSFSTFPLSLCNFLSVCVHQQRCDWKSRPIIDGHGRVVWGWRESIIR